MGTPQNKILIFFLFKAKQHPYLTHLANSYVGHRPHTLGEHTVSNL